MLYQRTNLGVFCSNATNAGKLKRNTVDVMHSLTKCLCDSMSHDSLQAMHGAHLHNFTDAVVDGGAVLLGKLGDDSKIQRCNRKAACEAA